jgi:DNA-directed RNA polymerase specialized sigma subunit
MLVTMLTIVADVAADGLDAELDQLVSQIMPQARAEAWRVYQRAPHALELDELHSIALKGLAEARARWKAYCAEKGHDPWATQYFGAYCCAPETPVLTSDLRWVPVGELTAGQELVSVEDQVTGKGRSRRYQAAKVLSAERRVAPCLLFTFEDGRQVICSADHRWLARYHGWKATASWNWVSAWKLAAGARVCSPLNVWQRDTSFDAGWLAGIIDGEGCYRTPHGLQISQNRGVVLERIFSVLDNMGIPYRIQDKCNSDLCVRVNVDQAWARLELLGRAPTTRLDGRPLWEDCQVRNRDGKNYAIVEKVEDAGLAEVVTLETSTGTYLANGLIAHNCTRRIRGAMLDAMRSQDWVTRSARTRAKRLRDFGQDQGATDEELAERSGMTITEVRETMAAVAAKPVSIDAEPHDVADEDDVEGKAVVGSILGAATTVLAHLGASSELVLALRYYWNLPVTDIAAVLGVEEDEAARLHTDAVLAVYDAMLRAVTA